MTEPQTNRPDSGGAAGLARDSAATGSGAVPPQAARQAQGQQGGQGSYEPGPADAADYELPGQDGAAGSGLAGRGLGGPGGLGVAIAGLAWTAALVAAIGMIAVGVLLLVWPRATLTVVAILIGAALIAAGLLRLFEGATARAETGGMRVADIVIGLLAVVAGLYCLKHHSLTVLVVALVVGVFWIIHGIGDIITASTSGKVPGRGFKAVSGVVSLAAGLVILFWPGITLVLLLTILGAWLIFYGIVLAGLAFQLRRGVRAETRPSKMAHA
jgi:uncharacterized membrane protein HdeD (DUF308 family)